MSTLRLTTISNQGGTASVPSDTVINGSAKAWVNFDGTGTVAIKASFNVSSITDISTGQYIVNFTTAMPDANYAIYSGAIWTVGNGWYQSYALASSPSTTKTSSGCGIIFIHTGNAYADPSDVSFVVHR